MNQEQLPQEKPLDQTQFINVGKEKPLDETHVINLKDLQQREEYKKAVAAIRQQEEQEKQEKLKKVKEDILSGNFWQ
jgi:hypothetical protein